MQLLKYHLKIVLVAVIFKFVLLQNTGLHVDCGRCGFLLQYLYLKDSLEHNLILRGKKWSLNPNQYNSLSDLNLKKLKLFLNVFEELFWNYYIGYPLHWSFILWTNYQIPLIYFPPLPFFSSFSSNYFDTQLLKSRQEMLRDWLRAGSQPMETSQAQNNVSLALLFLAFWNQY